MGEGGGANRVETGAGNQSITGDYFSKDESGEEQGEGGGGRGEGKMADRFQSFATR